MQITSGLSYFHRPGEQPLINLTVGQLLEKAYLQWRDREALVSIPQQRRLTFEDLRNEAVRAAAGLIRLGLKPGDRVGIWAPNCVEWIIVQFATAKAGLVLVNINPAYEADELRHCLRLANVRCLVMVNSYHGRKFSEILMRAAPDLIHVNNNNKVGHVESLELPKLRYLISIGTETTPKCIGFNDLLDPDLKFSEEIVRKVEKNLESHDAYNIQFTSGTTGKPKATLLSHHKIVNSALIAGKSFGYLEKVHRVCLPNPLFHIVGCVIGVLVTVQYGAVIVLPSSSYSPSNNVKAILTEKCDTIFGTTTMILDLIKEAYAANLKANELGLEQIVTGGAPFPDHLYKELRLEFGISNICNVYGMTESGSATFYTMRYDELEIQASTVGRLAEHWEAKVVDSNGRMLPFGQPGELWVRGYGNMLGYCENPEATNEAIVKDGWLRTGDLFILNEKGYGKIIGRIKDVIIRGGENIFPSEVEDVLYNHPDINEAYVYGIPDERLGEIVCASVKVHSDCDLEPEEVRLFCRGKMAHFKIPVYIDIVDEFPKIASGKIQKSRLREIMMEKLKK